MPVFAALFVSVFGSLTAFLAAVVGRKVAVAAASVTALGSLYAVLFLAFNLIVNPLASELFVTAWGQAIGLAFPPAAGTCLAALSAGWTACAAFGWNREAVRLAASA